MRASEENLCLDDLTTDFFKITKSLQMPDKEKELAKSTGPERIH